MNNIVIYSIGFLAQGLFSVRLVVQWFLSEKAKKVVSPVSYWQISILASYLLFIYGWLRDDFAIILGQYISYYIYIWNLNYKNQWKNLNFILRYLLLLTPVAVVIYFLFTWDTNAPKLFQNAKIPLSILIFGSMGQIIFTFRFIYQWIYSRRKGESLFPITFWLLSIVGSSIIISYGIYRKDPVLILGQSAGFIVYIRNLLLSKKK
ncbi:lipid-A-disaccharide synthase N-terminal domain-containing protein [uncultured Bacteroides sp.]|uniref:lipid-A-disaccharide synthase N-terminal domain-containing protein n=1 Tax=uncultured Bacteroides sp. TaxID=162156 RepID=UPI002AA894BD|nr:lipid-A-disaccharide synthase N-terminal domain-containing protein [uncultured Bacteroides sp.]